MADITTFTNAKGGVGKTTITLNMALCSAADGKRTLAIDLDQQGNLSVALGIDINDLKKTAHRLLIEDREIIDDYLVEVRPGLHILPNTLDPAADNLLDAKQLNRELLLRQKLDRVKNHFDVILIDTPPAIKTATLNALVCANSIVLTLDSSSFAMVAMSQMLQIIDSIQKSHNPTVKVYAVSSMYNKRQVLDQVLRTKAEDFFSSNSILGIPIRMLDTKIRNYTAIGMATAMGKGIVEDTSSPAAEDFKNLYVELDRSRTYEQE